MKHQLDVAKLAQTLSKWYLLFEISFIYNTNGKATWNCQTIRKILKQNFKKTLVIQKT